MTKPNSDSRSPANQRRFSTRRLRTSIRLRFPSMPESTVILNAAAIQRALTRIAHEIAERNEASSDVVLVGIQRGGVPLAQRLGALLTRHLGPARCPSAAWMSACTGTISTSRVAPDVHPTVIPFDVTGKTVVLVDDVLFSGRTIRAAMDALNDFGRPRRIQLAVLVDRGHRELPIKADFVGKNVPTALQRKRPRAPDRKARTASDEVTSLCRIP